MDIEIDESTIGFIGLIEKNEEKQNNKEQILEECPQSQTASTPINPDDNTDKLDEQQLDETTKLISQETPQEKIPKTWLEQLRELRQKQQKQRSEEENQKKYQSLLDEMETQTQINGLIELRKNKENNKKLNKEQGGSNKLVEILKKQAAIQSKTATSQIPLNPNQEEHKNLKDVKVEEGDIPKVQDIGSSSFQSKQKELRKDKTIQEDRIVNLSEINQKYLFKPKKSYLPTEVKYFLMFAGKHRKQSKFRRTSKQVQGNRRTYVEGEEEFKPNHSRNEKDRPETIKILRQHRWTQGNLNDRERSREKKTRDYTNINTGRQKSQQTLQGKVTTAPKQEKQSHFSKTIQEYKNQSRAIKTLQEILEDERKQKENGMDIEYKQKDKQSNSNVSKDFEKIKEVQKKEQIQIAETKQKIINNDNSRNSDNITKNIKNIQSINNNSSNCNSSNNAQQNISVQVKQESNNDSNNNLSKTIPVTKTVTAAAATVTPASNNSQVQGNEPSSCSISKKKGIVRGAKFFQQRKLEQDQEKKQLVQSHSQSNSQVKVEFEEITFQPSFLSKAKQNISSSSLNNQDKVIESRNGQPQESLNIPSQDIQKKLKIKKEEKEDIQIDTSYSNKTTDKVDLDKIQLKQEAVIPPTKSIWVSKKGLKLSNQQNHGAKDNSNNKTTTSKIDVKIEQVAPKQQELPKKELRNKKRPADLSYFVVDTSGDDDYDDEEDDDIDDGDEFEQEDSFENSKHRPSRLLVKEENNTKQKSSLTGVLQQSPSESKSKIKNPMIINNKSSLSTTSMVTRQEIKQQPQPISNQTPKQLNSLVQQSTIPQTRQQQLQQQQYVPLSNIKQQPQQQLQPQQQQQPTIVSQPQQKSTFFNTTSNSDFQSRTPQGNNNFSFINNVLNGNNSNFIPSSNPAFLDYKMPKTIFTQPFNTPVSILNNAPQTSNMNNNNNINSGFNNNNNNNNSQISSIMSFIRESDRGFLSQMLEKTKQDNNNANKVSNGNPSRQLL